MQIVGNTIVLDDAPVSIGVLSEWNAPRRVSGNYIASAAVDVLHCLVDTRQLPFCPDDHTD